MHTHVRMQTGIHRSILTCVHANTYICAQENREQTCQKKTRVIVGPPGLGFLADFITGSLIPIFPFFIFPQWEWGFYVRQALEGQQIRHI